MPKHLYSLDVARGFAALSVVFWHWSHFARAGDLGELPFVRAELPLYDLFFLFYERGALAVDFFFSLSGFVFFWLYRQKLTERKVGAWKFFALRFSRLYPLHLLTLLVTAALAFYYVKIAGVPFVYPNNDLYHFGLQAGMVSHWGLQSGHSFNGPIWSVSIEILLYGLFFLACRSRVTQPWQLLIAVGLGFVVKELVYPPLGRGIFSFYLGGICYYILSSERAWFDRAVLRKTLYALTGVAWVFAFGSTFFELGTRVVEALPALERRGALAGKVIDKLAFYYGAGVLFPLTILTLVTVEKQRGGLGRRFSFIGNVSYSSYLLHFPLQLLLVVLFSSFGISYVHFQSPLALIGFYLILIPVSLASYHWFERPVQSILRRRMLPK